MPLKEMARETSLIIGLAVVVALTVNGFSPNGISLLAARAFPECRDTASAGGAAGPTAYEWIDIFTAREAFQTGGVLFVDARGPEYFNNGHIPGAVSLPLDRFAPQIAAFKQKFSLETRMITYCYNTECTDSRDLAQLLTEAGFKHVAIFSDGFLTWGQEGFPVE